MSRTEDKKRWICPTDRELTLRAKLNSGWSIHTQDTFQKPDYILAPELRSIENVLERAKNIDLLEKERIEKLVCRLENMKRNAVGDGKRSCFMCGTAFGIFWNVSSNCADCLKAVCEKCRIDIHISSQEICLLCKICAENREVWKKSGGWFYGEVPAAVSCRKAFNTWEHKKPGGAASGVHRSVLLLCLDTTFMTIAVVVQKFKAWQRTWVGTLYKALLFFTDIVRLESFKPPEENYTELPLYKNWATNSSPDLSSLDEENVIFKEDRGRRKHSDSSGDELEMSRLSLPGDPSSKLSLSCPSLQEPTSSSPRPQYKQAEAKRHHRRIFSRKRLFTRRAVESISSKNRKST